MRTTLSLVSVLSLLAVACGDDDTPSPDASTYTDAMPQTDGPHPADAPPAPDAPPAAPDATPSGVYEGRLSMNESTLAGSGDQSGADVLFVTGSIWGPELGSDGDCTLYGAEMAEGFSAGTVTMTGGTANLTLTPMGTAPTVAYGTVVDPPLDAFAPGAVITMSATGSSDIPAFSGDVVAPEKLVGWTPPASISRAAGWSTTWTAGTADAFWVYVVGFDGGGNNRLLLCRTTDDGAYAVPASSLALIPATYNQAFAVAIRLNETVVSAGASTIYLYLVDLAGSDVIPLAP